MRADAGEVAGETIEAILDEMGRTCVACGDSLPLQVDCMNCGLVAGSLDGHKVTREYAARLVAALERERGADIESLKRITEIMRDWERRTADVAAIQRAASRASKVAASIRIGISGPDEAELHALELDSIAALLWGAIKVGCGTR